MSDGEDSDECSSTRSFTAGDGASEAGSWCESFYSDDIGDGENEDEVQEDYRPRRRAAGTFMDDMADAGHGPENPDDEEGEEGAKTRKAKTVTLQQYYRYMIHHRHSTRAPFSPLHYGGMGWQQYLTHMGMKLEDASLDFYRSEKGQKAIRSETYVGLHDFIENRALSKGMTCGKRVILPSTHPGSQRNVREKYHDAMSMCMGTAPPDLFVTITANPNWKEIQENLFKGQKWHDRNELVHRVFRLKLKAILREMIEERLFGEVIGFAMTIEYQKRGTNTLMVYVQVLQFLCQLYVLPLLIATLFCVARAAPCSHSPHFSGAETSKC